MTSLLVAWGSSGFAEAQVAGADPGKIPLEILEPKERKEAIQEFPVAVGMVFPDGRLSNVPGGRIVDDGGREILFDAEATGWWNREKTRVKWLLLHFKASTDRKYFFELGKKHDPPPGQPVAAKRNDEILVDTGPLKARISQNSPNLFDEIRLNDKPMLQPSGESFNLALHVGKGARRLALGDWKLALEEATPLRAVVKATGYYRDDYGADDDGKPVARLDIRYQFFKGESFVRIYHTITWMIRNYMIGARDISLALRPDLPDGGTLRLGLSDTTADAWEMPWKRDSKLTAYQDKGDHFAVVAEGKTVKEGRQLGGWFALQGADGRGVSVALRHPWQTFPTEIAVEDGTIRVGFWPRQGPPMSFAPEALMPPELFHHKVWKSFKWSADVGHFVHERARMRWYLHTAEGASRTHELTILFYDRAAKRSPSLMNSVTQHPVVVRQHPESAMRVPFMGFRIMPASKEKYPHIERAADLLGRMSSARWLSCHDYGLWRFGMLRWGSPPADQPRSLYRWMDGLQYDQQLIPWLLYMRGGDRHFFEQGEITGRFAMDVCVNHYNTRGYPIGYCSTAGGTPFPYVPYHTTKGTKIHFLAYYYHLTGYKRAKEVMDEIIAGAKQTAAAPLEQFAWWYRRTGGRECYNMNVFWANAYQETFDPEVEAFAREWMNLAANREYSRELNVFRPPQVYLYNGLVLQQRLWDDKTLREVMLRNLSADLVGTSEEGSVRNVEKVIGCGWAYEQTKDKRYAQAGWDAARTLADLVPNANLSEELPPPFVLRGNQFYRHFLLPILVGASVGHRLGLSPNQEPVLRDTFIALNAAAKRGEPASGQVFVRPRRDGDLKIRIFCNGGATKATLTGPDGKEIASAQFHSKKRTTVELEGPGYPVYARGSRFPSAEMVLPNAKRNQTYKLVIEGGSEQTGALVLADAQVVHHLPEGSTFLTQDLAGQYFAGARFYAMTKEDVITVTSRSPHRSPYTIRDAKTWELLFRTTATDPSQQTHRLGKGRLIVFITGGYSSWTMRSIRGVLPYFANTRDGWFDPSDGEKEDKTE